MGVLTQTREEETAWRRRRISGLTAEVEDLRPLLADVHSDIRSTHCQVGTTLVKHQGLDLQQGENRIETELGGMV